MTPAGQPARVDISQIRRSGTAAAAGRPVPQCPATGAAWARYPLSMTTPPRARWSLGRPRSAARATCARRQARKANDIAGSDWSNVGASVKNVGRLQAGHGGFLQSVGEYMDQHGTEDQPFSPLGREIATMGADAYQQGQRDMAENSRGLKPGIMGESVGTAVGLRPYGPAIWQISPRTRRP